MQENFLQSFLNLFQNVWEVETEESSWKYLYLKSKVGRKFEFADNS